MRPLLSPDGAILACDPTTGRLRTVPLSAAATSYVGLPDSSNVGPLCFSGLAPGLLPPALRAEIFAPATRDQSASGRGDDFVAIHGGCGSLSADGQGGVVATADPTPWLPLAPAAIAALGRLEGGTWIDQVTRAPRPAGPLLWRGDFRASHGRVRIDVALSRDMLAEAAADDIFVADEHGRVERLRRLNPVIAYTAFGNNDALFRCLAVSLDSLARLARYAGDVVVLSDRTPDALIPLVPEILRPRIALYQAPAADTLDAAVARYSLPLLPEVQRARPLLYVDTDVVFDRPIEGLLADVLLCGRVCVYDEDSLYHPGGFYGHALVADDPACIPRATRGFSTGVIGVPDPVAVAAPFRAVRGLTLARARLSGTRRFVAYDQPVANYLFQKLLDFDATVLNRYEVSLNGREPDADDPRGLAHFAGGIGNAEPKFARMSAYLQERLRRESSPV